VNKYHDYDDDCLLTEKYYTLINIMSLSIKQWNLRELNLRGDLVAAMTGSTVSIIIIITALNNCQF